MIVPTVIAIERLDGIKKSLSRGLVPPRKEGRKEGREQEKGQVVLQRSRRQRKVVRRRRRRRSCRRG